MANDTFLDNQELESDVIGDYEEPVELIISRVVFALLVSVSLVFNLLLLMAVIRRQKNVHVVYILTTAMIIPDLGA